ncbi:hypothetical protein Hanom_Chr12g01127701 [Helianthus anomalus]
MMMIFYPPPIQSMITNKPRKLKLNKKPKKVNVEDDDDFEAPIKDLNTKRAKNTKKGANTLTDEDFEEPIKKFKRSKQDRQMAPTKSKQTINEAELIRTEPIPYYAYHHEAISLRCSPSAFLDTIRQFTKAQIADVKSIGFGHVLDIKIIQVNVFGLLEYVVVEITKSTIVKQSFLLAIDKEEDISKLDWCSFVLESLKRTRQGWKKLDSQYNGPVAFLTVSSIHPCLQQKAPNFNEVVKLPIIKYITSGMIDDMEEYIYNNGLLSDFEDYDEFDKDDETHGNSQDQQHATAADNTITDDHQNEQAPTPPLENINQQLRRY